MAVKGVRIPKRWNNKDPEQMAASADLRYVSDDEPGWTRRRSGTGFTYLDGTGSTIKGKDRDRLNELAVPPAWEDVWFAPIHDSHLLATGRDAEGRKQYRYHQDFRDAMDELKFRRLAYFGRALRRLRPEVERTLVDEEAGSHRFALAAATRMLDSGLLRVGNDVYRKQSGAQGATTLTNDSIADVNVADGTVHLRFLGKGSNERDVELDDQLLADTLDELLEMPDEALFVYLTEDGTRSITSTELNTFVADIIGPSFSAKDFRTWGGTVSALEALAGGDKVLEAVDAAADALGNTRSVARSSYIAPSVLKAGNDGRLDKFWTSSRTSKYLSRPERAAERLLLAVNEQLS